MADYYERVADPEEEMWGRQCKWVKGLEGRFAVDIFGKVYYKSRKGEMKLSRKKDQTYNYLENGKFKTFQVPRAVWEAFKGPIPEGYYVVHKGLKADHAVMNLKLSKNPMRGGSNRKPVLKKDKDGNVVEVYGSIKEAADNNYISDAALRNHIKGGYCHNGKTHRYKEGYTLDGYYYELENKRGRKK